MPSTTSGSPSPFDGPTAHPPSSSPQPSSKRRHRVDSIPSKVQSTSSTAAAPDPKRARSEVNEMPTYSASVSAKVQGKRPEVIDLTTHDLAMHNSGFGGSRRQLATSTLQPHKGAKKLVIKNLRAPTTARVDQYYERIWQELDAALTAIFSGHPTQQPWELLYRGVEDICRRGETASADLAERLRSRCEAHLTGDQVLGRIRAGSASATGPGGDGTVLRSVLGQWKRWSEQLLIIRWIYSFLDRSFLLKNSKTLQTINDMGISQFRRAVFVTSHSTRDDGDKSAVAPPGTRVLAGMCELVGYDRRVDERFDGALFKDSVTMLRLFGVYGKSFEPRFLAESHEYFLEFAEERSVSYGLKDYINACERLLARESERCDVYNLDSTTKRQLRDDAHHILIEKYSSKLLDNGSVARLLAANDVESMKALYDLLKLSGIQKKLTGPWEDYIGKAGAEIVGDTARGDDMVVRLLELRRALDIMIRDAFGKDEDFTYGLREEFGHFINDQKNASSWNTGTSKVGEMVAKHVDMLLRGGLKTLPATLLSDVKDRAAAEKSGLASTGDEDAELDRQLDHALELFRFIEGKDVFEAFYKKDLARRLLMGRSASQDAERNMLQKLKSECGSSFTHNLEQMFKDQELAKDEMASYRDFVSSTGRASKAIDLTVNILSAAAWPTYPDVRVHLPQEVLEEITAFDSYYKNKHTGRRLTWKHNLAHCVVKARFDKGVRELLVSAFQAVVLVLFNEVEGKPKDEAVLSYEQMLQSTGLPGPELKRTLQSLACGKIRVLAKHPKGKDVSDTDTFTVNRAFYDPKVRIKINQIQLRETREENQETHKRVQADRQFETQAAIVRIMKSRKTMTHQQLVAEVINQTKARGAVDPVDIKLNIEKLIDKDYIEREGGMYTYLA